MPVRVRWETRKSAMESLARGIRGADLVPYLLSVGKSSIMRFPIGYVITVAALQAQAPLSGTVALEKFTHQLASFTRMTRISSEPVSLPVPAKICAIPLLQVPVDRSVDPQMAIPVKNDAHFSILQVVPPAPSCAVGNVSWK